MSPSELLSMVEQSRALMHHFNWPWKYRKLGTIGSKRKSKLLNEKYPFSPTNITFLRLLVNKLEGCFNYRLLTN